MKYIKTYEEKNKIEEISINLADLTKALGDMKLVVDKLIKLLEHSSLCKFSTDSYIFGKVYSIENYILEDKYAKDEKDAEGLSINYSLNPLIDVFIELLTKLAEYDNFEGYKIKKYFTEDTVTIKYNIPSTRNFFGTNITLFEIKIFKLYNNNGYSFSTIEATKKYIFEDNFDSRKLIEDELMKIRNKYVNHYDNLYRGGRDKFTDEDLDDIIKDTKKIISDFELKLNMNKYNL